MSTARTIENMVKPTEGVLTSTCDATVADAALQMRCHGVGCLIVLDDRERIAGILTERDVVCGVVAECADPSAVLVESIMTQNVVACTKQTSISKARAIMAERGIRHLPVLEDTQLVGMISSRDIMGHELAAVKAMLRRQSKVLHDLESKHPGITRLQTDPTGRLVI